MMVSVLTAGYRQASKEHISPTKTFEHLIIRTEKLLEIPDGENAHLINVLTKRVILHGMAHSLHANAHALDETT